MASLIGTVLNRMGSVLASRFEGYSAIRQCDEDEPADLLARSFTSMHPDAVLPFKSKKEGERLGDS